MWRCVGVSPFFLLQIGATLPKYYATIGVTGAAKVNANFGQSSFAFNFHKTTSDFRNFVRRRSSKQEGSASGPGVVGNREDSYRNVVSANNSPIPSPLSSSHHDKFFERKRHTLTHPISHTHLLAQFSETEKEKGEEETRETAEIPQKGITARDLSEAGMAGSEAGGPKTPDTPIRKRKVAKRRKTNERHTLPHPLLFHQVNDAGDDSSDNQDTRFDPRKVASPLWEQEDRGSNYSTPSSTSRDSTPTRDDSVRAKLPSLPGFSPPVPKKDDNTAEVQQQQKGNIFPADFKLKRVKEGIPGPLPSPNRVPTQSRSSSDLLNKEAASTQTNKDGEQKAGEKRCLIEKSSSIRTKPSTNKRTRSKSSIEKPVLDAGSSFAPTSPPPPKKDSRIVISSSSDTPLQTFISQNPTIDSRQPLHSRSRGPSQPLPPRKVKTNQQTSPSATRLAPPALDLHNSRDWNKVTDHLLPPHYQEFQELVSELRNARDDYSHIEVSRKMCALGRDFLTVAKVGSDVCILRKGLAVW